MLAWRREKISYCFCTEMKQFHVHCPCLQCKGKAISRWTELCHCKTAMMVENYCHSCTQNIDESSLAHAHSNSVCSSSIHPNMDEDPSVLDTHSHFSHEQELETHSSTSAANTDAHDTSLESVYPTDLQLLHRMSLNLILTVNYFLAQTVHAIIVM